MLARRPGNFYNAVKHTKKALREDNGQPRTLLDDKRSSTKQPYGTNDVSVYEISVSGQYYCSCANIKLACTKAALCMGSVDSCSNPHGTLVDTDDNNDDSSLESVDL